MPNPSRPGSALLALAIGAAASPATGQTIFYEDGDYLYAVPAPERVADEDDVVTRSLLVSPEPADIAAVRVIPARAPIGMVEEPGATAPLAPAIILPEMPISEERFPVIVQQTSAYRTAPGYAPVAYGAVPYTPGSYVPAPYAPPVYAPATYAAPGYAPAAYVEGAFPSYEARPGYEASGTYLPNGGQLVQFDREVWLGECRARLASYDENDRGRVIGALAGALAGGFVGNRLADGNRLGGTLLGAGLGGLAGSAVGDAADDRADRRALGSADDYCADYLDDYMARASNHGASVAAYSPGQQYMLVPVSVPVAQQTVYREYAAPGN